MTRQLAPARLYSPLKSGYDRFFGIFGGSADYFNHGPDAPCWWDSRASRAIDAEAGSRAAKGRSPRFSSLTQIRRKAFVHLPEVRGHTSHPPLRCGGLAVCGGVKLYGGHFRRGTAHPTLR